MEYLVVKRAAFLTKLSTNMRLSADNNFVLLYQFLLLYNSLLHFLIHIFILSLHYSLIIVPIRVCLRTCVHPLFMSRNVNTEN
jgi:hypothetical protein